MSNFSSFFKTDSVIRMPELAGYMPNHEHSFRVVSVQKGGMGECIHLRTISSKCDYALKCIRPDLIGEDDAINQFHHELGIWVTASACDAVSEAIVVIRINEIPAVLQPWMAGGDLSHALQNMTVESKIQTFLRVVRGLDWVYSNQGVIHCDLKPANILLDEKGISYIADWGLARLIGSITSGIYIDSWDERINKARLKLANTFSGTILYSAPEQILNPQTVDHRTDIYALGCMMYEMETGSPPFLGTTFMEIARKHIEEKPPKLGGLFKRTATGLEKIIERCMEKSPANRYATYSELENSIIQLSNNRGYSLAHCKVAKRYERYQLGTAYNNQKDLIKHASEQQKNANYVLMNLKQLEPFISEAQTLLAVERYEEASMLLAPLFIPFMLEEPSEWHLGHSLAEVYASALVRSIDKQNDAVEIYQKLTCMKNKPAEFYVNYSLLLLKLLKFQSALTTCIEGLSNFPDDIDIIGNQTIALRNLGDLDNANKSAQKRLILRRDVHSIAEAIAVNLSSMMHLRDQDLPKAMEIAIEQFNLISEGLRLNPRFPSFHIAKLQLYCFVENGEQALEKYNEIANQDYFNSSYKQHAFILIVEYLSNTKNYKTALELIEKCDNILISSALKDQLDYIKLKTYADKQMLINYKSRERVLIREVVDYFLQEQNGTYQHPIMTARILEWTGELEKSEKLLLSQIDTWEAKKHLALMKQRMGDKTNAYMWASNLVKSAPWKAESYDVFAYIAELEGDSETQSKMRFQGEKVFEKEIVYYNNLQKR